MASRVVQARVTPEQSDWLDLMAAGRGITVSELLRLIIDRARVGSPAPRPGLRAPV